MSDEARPPSPTIPDEKPEKPANPPPERAKMMSDVRYFMRQPSTPWIVFDQNSKVDADEAGAEPAQEPVEPSNVVVAKDIEGTPEEGVPASRQRVPSHISVPEDVPLDDLEPHAKPTWRKTRVMTAAGVAAAFITIIAVAALRGNANGEASANASTSMDDRSTPTTTTTSTPTPTTTSTTTTTPTPTTTSTPTTTTTTTTTTTPTPTPNATKTGSGWIAIRGSATRHRVYLDGKLLLGNGSRSFPVRCGEHTVAIDDKGAKRDIDVPCNGELQITK
jgi:hypothetical protein